MGIYLYAIRAKAHKMVLPNGEKVTANEMRFLFNGGTFFNPKPVQQAMRTKIELYWDGKELPPYVVMVDEEGPKKNSRVYRWTGKTPFWVDCDQFPGDLLGYLNRVDGSWKVGPCQHEPRSENSVPPCDETTGQDICVNCGMLFGPENRERAAAYKARMEKWAQDRLEEAARANEQARRYELEKKALVSELARPVWTVEVEIGFEWMRGKLNFEQKANAEEYARRVAGARKWRVVEVT